MVEIGRRTLLAHEDYAREWVCVCEKFRGHDRLYISEMFHCVMEIIVMMIGDFAVKHARV